MKHKTNNKPLIAAVLVAHLFFATVSMLTAQNTRLPVGAIPGEIDVSPMGAATYTIPIEVVPGTQGVQPNLSILYNSYSGMGMLGMKWSISGLSAISRCGQIPYFDKKTGTTQLNFNDRFALDGARLLQMSAGDYGGNEVEYATESENFTRVVSYGGGTTGPPDYFKAYTDDGTVIEYGYANNSKQQFNSSDPHTTLNWFVNKITDANGNYMTFHYKLMNREIRIDSIKYTGNSNSYMPTYAKVVFSYNDIPEDLGKNTAYVGGYDIPHTQLLNAVTVFYNNVSVRKYSFNYMHETSQNERSVHLKEIVLSSYDDNGRVQQLNSTTIKWGNKNFSIVAPQAITGFPANFPDGKLLPGDFNGDGYTDFVVYDVAYSGNDKKWYLYLFNPKNKVYEQSSWTIYTPEHGDASFYAQDISGKGKDNLIIGMRKYNSSQNIYYQEFKICSPDINSVAITTLQQYDYYGITFGDFDGNGITDIMFISVTIKTPVGKRWTAHWTLSFYSEHSNGSMNAIYFNSDYTYKAIPDIRIVNLNGKNGVGVKYINTNVREQHIIYELEESGFVGKEFDSDTPFFSNLKYSFYGDVNGDGHKEILVCQPWESPPYWELFIAKGDKTFIQYNLGAVLNPDWLDPLQTDRRINQVRFADLNGDGKEDIIQGVNFGSKTSSFNILLSKRCQNGAYIYSPITLTNIQGMYSSLDNWTIGDVNGDGKFDIILLDNYKFSLPIRYISFNQDNDYEFVKEITDGIGKTIQLNYKHQYFTAKSTHPDDRYPHLNLFKTSFQKNFFSIVDSVRVSNGPGYDLNTLKYRFHSLTYSLPKRTLLGFNEVVSINVQENRKDSLIFTFPALNTACYNIWKQVLQPHYNFSFVGDVNTSMIRYSLEMKDLDNHPRFMCSGDRDEYNYLTKTLSEAKTILNNQGRIITSTVKTYDGISPDPAKCKFTKTNSYSYKGICFMDQFQHKTVPTSIISTQQYGNGPIITGTTTYNYGELGRVASVQETNSDGSITTTYENYLMPGVYKTKTVTAAEKSRTETYGYDETRRFATSIKNDLKHETTFLYDSKTGNKTKETDPNGLVTKYDYDVFGNLTLVTYPDGTETTTSVQWEASQFIPKAKYSVSTQTTAKPLVKVYYDLLGREVCRKEDGAYYETKYNRKGQVDSSSYPFTGFNQKKIWHEYTYDIYGRKLTEKAPYTNLSYSYTNNNRTITTIHNGISSSKGYDALGRMTTATDQGGVITYNYAVIDEDNTKQHKTTISVQGGGITTIITDLRGNRLSITDPNAGTITSTYNGFGELLTQTDANENVTSYQYDILGRVTQKKFTATNGSLQKINYIYDTANKGKGKLHKIKVDDVETEIYNYDNLSRLSEHKKKIDNTLYTQTHTYNNDGQLQTLTYPDGFSIKYSYLSDGKLDKILHNDNSNSLIYKVHTRNMYNQTTKCEYGNEVVTQRTYNDLGLITRIQTGTKILIGDEPWIVIKGDGDSSGKYYVDSTILNYRYAYNNKGLMSFRSESVINCLEMYEYDALDRLTFITAGAIGQTGIVQEFKYYANGNIKNNSNIGTYTYGTTMMPPKPHAVTEIEPINNIISANQCDVTYNYFNQPTQITEGSYKLNLFYNANQQRNKAIKYRNGIIDNTRIYFNKKYEKEIDVTNITRHYHYIYGDDGVVALHIATPTTNSMYYIHTDHLGSYCAITDQNKKIAQRNYFDAWGNMPKLFFYSRGDSILIDEQYSGGDTLVSVSQNINFALTPRGFTGHEHYPYFKIINMNGRLYDPVIGRFFSPDKYVANSSFTQDFNRYTYARNNPLMYTDPDGNFPLLLPLIAGAWMGFMQGALMGSASGATGWDMFGYMAGGMAIGATAGLISAGVGSAVSASLGGLGAGVGFISGMASGAVGGALNGFGMGLLGGQGGSDLWKSVWQGALLGAGTGAVMGAITGGINAKAMGGNFWSGKGAKFEFKYTLGKGSKPTAADIQRGMDYNESMTADINNQLSLPKKMGDNFNFRKGDYGFDLTTNVPEEWGWEQSTGIYLDTEGNQVGGVIRGNWGYPSTYKMHISPYALGADNVTFNAIAGHEIIHAYHVSMFGIAMKLPRYNFNSEVSAYSYSYQIFSNAGRELEFFSRYIPVGNTHRMFSYPASFGWPW